MLFRNVINDGPRVREGLLSFLVQSIEPDNNISNKQVIK